MVYLPTKLGHKNGANVGIHIPAPWFAYGYHDVSYFRVLKEFHLSHFQIQFISSLRKVPVYASERKSGIAASPACFLGREHSMG